MTIYTRSQQLTKQLQNAFVFCCPQHTTKSKGMGREGEGKQVWRFTITTILGVHQN